MPRRLIARREVREAGRGLWFLVNSSLFALGGVLLVLFGEGDVTVLGYRGYARSLAGLMQLAMFFVPLVALFPAAGAIAGERDAGTLDFLLAQPLSRGELYAGKWLGVTTAVSLSLGIGLALVGSVAIWHGVPPGLVLALALFCLLLGSVFTSLGLWISARAGSRSRATSLGLAAWLLLVALGTLGVMGTFVRWGLPPAVLEAWSLVNPVEAFRLAMISLLDPGARMLGPVGAALRGQVGRGGLVTAAGASLTLWSAALATLGRRGFARGGEAARRNPDLRTIFRESLRTRTGKLRQTSGAGGPSLSPESKRRSADAAAEDRPASTDGGRRGRILEPGELNRC